MKHEHPDPAFGGMPAHPADSTVAEGWEPWTVKVPAGVAGGLAGLLGTLGFFVVSFGVGSNCTDQFDCGSDTCAPCTSAHSWISAGAIGQWALVLAVIMFLIAGLRQSGRRRAIAISIWAVIPLACGWIALSTAAAQASF